MQQQLVLSEFYSIAVLNSEPIDNYQLENLGFERVIASGVHLRSRGGGRWETKQPVKKEDYDRSFISKIIRIDPPYELDKLINYHFDYYFDNMGSKDKFLKHIEYVIVPYLEKFCNKQIAHIELTKEWISLNKKRNNIMIEYNDLENTEKEAINKLVQSVPSQYLTNSYIRFDKPEVEGYIPERKEYHYERIIRFLITNDFVILFTHRPDYEFTAEGRKLLKYGSLEKFYEKKQTNQIMSSNINVSGNGNFINNAGGNIEQSNITVKVTAQNYKELEELGVDPDQIEELRKLEEIYKNDKSGFITQIKKFSGDVIKSVAVKGLLEKIPQLTEFFGNLIHQHS